MALSVLPWSHPHWASHCELTRNHVATRVYLRVDVCTTASLARSRVSSRNHGLEQALRSPERPRARTAPAQALGHQGPLSQLQTGIRTMRM
ncbi:hypothetical protein PO909_032046 [Leuciscus waleckii]